MARRREVGILKLGILRRSLWGWLFRLKPKIS